MSSSSSAVRRLTVSGLIAAMYAVLSLATPYLTFGVLQCRLAEGLALLPLLYPEAIPGLAVGCLVTNLIGAGTGANVAGAWDILFGTLATLLSAFLSRLLRRVTLWRVPVLSLLPPIVINGAVVGAELCFVALARFSAPVFFTQAGLVAAGETIALVFLGIPLYFLAQRLPKTR